jgi:hypothetical protein
MGLGPMSKKHHKLGLWSGKASAAPAKALAALLLCLGAAAAGLGQIKLPAGPVPMAAGISSSLTVMATPALVNFTLVPNGVANGTPAVNITTAWSLNQSSRVSLYAYFTSPGSALSDAAGDKISAANVSGSVNGAAFRAFTQSSPFAASSSITIFSRRIGTNDLQDQRTDTLNLQINTGGLALPAGGYSGLLVIQAQAI